MSATSATMAAVTKPSANRRYPARAAALGEEQVDPRADRRRDQSGAHPIHPAGGRTAGVVGGHRLEAEGDSGDTDYQDEDEDRAVSPEVDHDAAEQRVDFGHPAVDRCDNATATDRRPGPLRRSRRIKNASPNVTLQPPCRIPAHHHDFKRGAHDAQQRADAQHNHDSDGGRACGRCSRSTG